MASRRPFVGGNWKMNTDLASAVELADDVVAGCGQLVERCDVAVFPPFPYLQAVGRTLGHHGLLLGAQDLYHMPNGAYTGEVSTEMLLDLNVRVVLVGHSERRHVIGEDDDLVNAKLKAALEEISDEYDYIIIDCPPSLGLLTVNSLTASDSVLIPLQCEFYAMEGLSQLVRTVNLIRQHLNPKLYIEGILLTMFDKRNNISHQVAQDVKEHFEEKVFETVIPRNVKLSESPSFGKPVLLYDIGCTGSSSYLDLAKELMYRRN